MLVLTRREGEDVIIGDPNNPIGRVRVVDIRGERVRIGFDFRSDIPVHRASVAADIAAGVPRPTRSDRSEVAP